MSKNTLLKIMILFLYGENTYTLQQKLKAIENRYKQIHKRGLNLEKMEVSKIEFREFWEKFTQHSIFIKKKLFILENLFTNQKFKAEFFKKIERIANSKDIVVLTERKKFAKNDNFIDLLKKYAKYQEFFIFGKERLKKWIKKEIKKYSLTIREGALEKLINFTGEDCWKLSNEIKKLISFKKTPKIKSIDSEIKSKDVELLVSKNPEIEIFETINALAQKDKKRTLQLIQNHLEKGESPLYLLKMINFQFRNLLILKLLQSKNKFSLSNFQIIARSFAIHPYVIKKTGNLLRNFSLSELKKIYQEIFKIDLFIKTGKISPQEGVKWLVIQI